ncbi:MAG: DEAD/DEAH box helicase [Bacteroidaceae bacterium]|nr:DEAD/DEAH box helicase [Bacteroidaceae bacterium]
MQEETIAAYRKHRQLVLLSPTGSGKTLAYLLPLVEELSRNVSDATANSPSSSDSKWPQALVLVPSRELASQTVDVVRAMKCGLRAMACYGGRPAMDEHRTMREVQPHIIVATPGRAADHLRKDNFDGEAVTTLIIDEFDKSLELGFQDEMSAVLQLLPRVQRRFLLSATDSEQIPAFAGEGFFKLDFTDPADDVAEANDRLTLHLLRSPEKDKLKTLRDLLCHLGDESSMVFVNYRESVERVANYLRQEGFSVSAFHGGMEQRDRERALYRFAGGAALTLVSTDLAARGLDIDDVRHIIHYHLPQNADAFTHRNGRTARWDKEGEAWLILGPEEETTPDFASATPLPLNRLHTSAPVPKPRWTSLYIGKGRKDKINKVDIVGFLSKIGGLQREELGRVDVGDHWAYAAVARQRADEVLRRVKGMKIKGVKTLIEKAR